LEKFTLVAKTLAGLEEILAEEINHIGGQKIRTAKRAVIFKGDKKILYKANYELRTALRILKQIHTFTYRNVDEFYNHCREVNWPEWMDLKNTFAVYSTVNHSKVFRNSMFASLKAKDAIADLFRQKTGRRPDINTVQPDIIIALHISGNTCTLSLDSSGEPLYKRGYRVGQTQAPLNEVLAAGMILLSGWKGDSPFIDPMCGSGTLPVEAALIATQTPPGIFRKSFGFEKWMDFDNTLLKKIAQETNMHPPQQKIYASDLSARNIGIAKANARNAGVYKYINFAVSDFKDLKIKTDNATLIINPPYGERLRSTELENLYAMTGERLKHQYPGNTAWIMSSSKELLKKVGLKHNQRMELYNGPIKCEFRKYELFEGSQKMGSDH